MVPICCTSACRMERTVPHERRWEHEAEHRILNEYSDSEREAEYAALESQRRQLRACLRTEAEYPPPLGRKLLIPLPLTTPPFFSLNSPPGDEGVRIKSEAVALLITDDARPPSFASEGRINEAAVRQQLSIEPTKQRSLSSHPSLRRPSLRIVIPGSSHQEPWLSGPLFSSPLSGSGTDARSPSVLLNARAIRVHLDLVHGPHPLPPEPGSPLLSYPSPPRSLSPSNLVTDNRAEQMSPKHLIHHGARTILPLSFPSVSTKLNSGSKPGAMAFHPSTWPVYQPQPIYPTKRRASLGIIAAVRGSSKRPRLIPRS